MKNKAKGLVAGLAAVATGLAFAPAVSAADPGSFIEPINPGYNTNLMDTAKTVMNVAMV